MFRRRLVSIVFFTLMGAILFGSAGRLDLPTLRACWAGCVISAVALVPLVEARIPGPMAERPKLAPAGAAAASSWSP